MKGKIRKILNIFKNINNLENVTIKLSSNEILNFDIKIIDIFDINTKQSKSKNDFNNKIRENIICYIINKNIPLSWYKFHYKWYILRENLEKYITNLNQNVSYKNIECIIKGGRNYNYDFEFKYILENDIEIIKKIEFKFGCNKIDKYPQFLSLSTKNNCSYADYFYDYYIENIANLYNIEKISKKDFIDNIYSINYNKNDWFKKLYNMEKLNNKLLNQIMEKDKIVDLSINNFIMIYCYNLDINFLSNKFIESQKDKHYMCYDGKFNYDFIDENEIKISKISGFKGKIGKINSIIFDTYCNTKIHMLLRWKNHYGVLNPAWQISIKR